MAKKALLRGQGVGLVAVGLWGLLGLSGCSYTPLAQADVHYGPSVQITEHWRQRQENFYQVGTLRVDDASVAPLREELVNLVGAEERDYFAFSMTSDVLGCASGGVSYPCIILNRPSDTHPLGFLPPGADPAALFKVDSQFITSNTVGLIGTTPFGASVGLSASTKKILAETGLTRPGVEVRGRLNPSALTSCIQTSLDSMPPSSTPPTTAIIARAREYAAKKPLRGGGSAASGSRIALRTTIPSPPTPRKAVSSA
ncbi:MAG: hypothetical protein AB7S68_00765 [Polyangiaceae bacterium]